jgi:hypothetical protein
MVQGLRQYLLRAKTRKFRSTRFEILGGKNLDFAPHHYGFLPLKV